LWQNWVLKDLGTLGGNDAQAIFVNDRGQVAGISYLNSTPVINSGFVCTLPGQTTFIPPQDPFLWENGKMVDLGNLGGNCAAPAAINIRGQVAGNSDVLDPNALPHAFLWSRETGMKDLDTLGGTFSQADALTDSGEVVGTASTAQDDFFLAVLWKNGAITNLGTLTGDSCSSAYAINSKGQIVGDSLNICGDFSTARPFLWQNGQIFGFNLVPPPGTQLISAEPASINDRGEIVGFAALNTGSLAFILIPCDPVEPCEDVTTSASASPQAVSSLASLNSAAALPNLTPVDKVALLRAQFDRHHRVSRSNSSTRH
jgi:probable HAF family extracellular repeat protein